VLRGSHPAGYSLKQGRCLHESRRIAKSDDVPEVFEAALQALGAVDGWLPAQKLPGAGDVRLAPFRVVLGKVLVDDRALGALDQGDDLLGELQHGDLGGIPQVGWL